MQAEDVSLPSPQTGCLGSRHSPLETQKILIHSLHRASEAYQSSLGFREEEEGEKRWNVVMRGSGGMSHHPCMIPALQQSVLSMKLSEGRGDVKDPFLS